MDNLNLGSDESIIKPFERIIISGVRHRVVLTSRRILLLEAESDKIRREIAYPDIILAVQGSNRMKEPTVTLTFITSGGEERLTEELIFVHTLGGLNIQACDSCMDILKQHQVPVRGASLISTTYAENRLAMAGPSSTGGVTATGRPAVPNLSLFGPTYSQKSVTAEEQKGIPPLTIAAVILAILVVIAGVIMIGNSLAPKSPKVDKTPAVPTPTAAAAPPPEMFPTPTVPVTGSPVMAITTPPVVAHDNGIWIRIDYPKMYTGSLKAKGWYVDVNNTGTSFYQLPVQNTLIEGNIAKMDGSGGMMRVGVYNGGALVSEQVTIKPFGFVDLHLNVGPSLGGTVLTPPSAPVIPAVTPDTSLNLKAVPTTGVWARVSYPGNFTGTITANGISQDLEGTGDQFYQLSVSSGPIDGVIEKKDGSARNIIIQVYKDGALVMTLNSTKPLAVLDFHTKV